MVRLLEKLQARRAETGAELGATSGPCGGGRGRLGGRAGAGLGAGGLRSAAFSADRPSCQVSGAKPCTPC